VDGGDLSNIGNQVDAFAVGYIPEDVNGDGAIDGSDLSIAATIMMPLLQQCFRSNYQEL